MSNDKFTPTYNQLLALQRQEILNQRHLDGKELAASKERASHITQQINKLRAMDTGNDFVFLPNETLQSASDKVFDYFNKNK